MFLYDESLNFLIERFIKGKDVIDIDIKKIIHYKCSN